MRKMDFIVEKKRDAANFIYNLNHKRDLNVRVYGPHHMIIRIWFGPYETVQVFKKILV